MFKFALGIAVAVAAFAAAHAQNQPKNDFILHAKDVPPMPIALWVENGQPKVARGDDVASAPKDAAKVMSRAFNYPGGAIREAYLTKGTKYTPPGGHLTVIYVAKGHLRITEGGVTGEALAGDSFSEFDGRPTVIEVLEDTIDIETSFPNPPAGTK
jgi:hypothetical protein